MLSCGPCILFMETHSSPYPRACLARGHDNAADHNMQWCFEPMARMTLSSPPPPPSLACWARARRKLGEKVSGYSSHCDVDMSGRHFWLGKTWKYKKISSRSFSEFRINSYDGKSIMAIGEAFRISSLFYFWGVIIKYFIFSVTKYGPGVCAYVGYSDQLLAY